MKIKKEDIKRIISILEDKYNELSDNEYFEFNGNNLVRFNTISLPEFHYLPKATNEEEAQLITEYYRTLILKAESYKNWNNNDSKIYHLYIENTNTYKNGWCDIKESEEYKDYKLVSLEDIKLILNQNKQ